MTNVIQLPDTSRLNAALDLASRGFYVFPVHSVTALKSCTCGAGCGRVGKHPRTQHGVKDASTEPAEIRDWFKMWPDANIGIACGPSRLVVVDVDPRNDGDNGLVELQRVHGELPRTLTCLTGGGGWHFYYRVPDGVDRVRSHVPVQGVEIKASGLYVVAPPSTHLLGEYRWDVGQADAPAVAPFWMIDIPVKAQSASGPPVDGLMGQAFIASGMNGPMLGPNKMAVQCPWEGDHSQGSRFDSSTVVFGPSGGARLGWFHCSHAHCQARAASGKELQRLVLDALPQEAVAEAKKRTRGGEAAARTVSERFPWESSIKYTPKGDAAPEAGTLQLMLENMDEWRGCVSYDECRDKVVWHRQPPELHGMRVPLEREELGDSAWIYTSHWFSLKRNVTFRKEIVQDVLVSAAKARPFNSLQQHLESLEWDRVPRLAYWLSAFCGARNDAYTQFVSKAWVVSAIARAMNPGVQVDHTLVLEGKQGAGKTSAFRILGGDWYSSFSVTRIDDKDARMQVHGAWIIEIAELAALQYTDMVKAKAFLSDTHDRYRPPYGRAVIEKGRRCVFAGTTNEDDYIRDSTGARRFWPVKVGTIDTDGLVEARNQILAEAIVAYRDGAKWWPDRRAAELLGMLEVEQDLRISIDPWESRIRERLEMLEKTAQVRGDEIYRWVELSDVSKRDRAAAARISSIMRKLGWERTRIAVGNTLQWIWVKVT